MTTTTGEAGKPQAPPRQPAPLPQPVQPSRTPIAGVLPDLALETLTAAGSNGTRGPLLRLRLRNGGTASTPPGVTVALWARLGGPGGKRVDLGRLRYGRSLPPGAVSDALERPLPAGLAIAGGRVCALVDADASIVEGDESNNHRCIRLGPSRAATSVADRGDGGWRLDALPVSAASLDALARGDMRAYVLIRLDRNGRAISRERVRALVGAWRPRPADMQPARAFVRFPDGRTVPAGDWYWSDTGDLWLPLTGEGGRMMGVMAVSRDGEVRMTIDVDGDGVADLAARESLTTGEAVLMFPEGDRWRTLVEGMLARGDVCAAAREAGLAGGGAAAGRGGFMPGFAGGGGTRRLALCGRSAGGAGGAGGTGPTGDDDRCAELLARTPASPEGGPPDMVRSERGSTRNLVRNSRNFVIGLVCVPCGIYIAGRNIVAAFRNGGSLRTVIKEAASAANPYVGVTFVIGDYLTERGREAQREEYVNEYDEMLDDMETMCGDLGPDECAARKGVKPHWRTVQRACSAGSDSAYCQDPKWAQPPWQRTRGGTAKPLPGSEWDSGPTVEELMGRSCLERAKYRDRVRGALLGPVEEECPDPRSQPSPARLKERVAEAGRDRDAPQRMRSYCTGDQERETRPPPEMLADILGRGRCQDPTARPREGEGGDGPSGRRCVRGKLFGLGAGRGTIGVAYGTVVGIDACPEATCDPVLAGR